MKLKIIMAFLCGWSLVGCSGFVSDEEMIQSTLSEVSKGSTSNSLERPQCEMDYAEYILDAKLLGFELKDKSNVKFGFNLLQGFLKAFGFKFNSEKGTMTMAMQLSQSIHPTEPISHVTGEGESKTTDFGMSIDFIKLGLDVDYYYKTPISKLTEKTIDNTLSQLSRDMSGKETPWNSKVVSMFPPQGQIIMPAGTVAGIKLGDTFGVYNIDHVWSGGPCSSEYLIARKRTQQPIAIFRVIQLEKNASLLQMSEYRSEEPIEMGALVEVANLAQGRGAEGLLRSVRIRDFKSHPLPLLDSESVDLSLYISEQTKSLLNRHGYYPRN